MDWQQKIFRQAWHWFQGLRPESSHIAPTTVSLEQIRGRLTLFARLLTGEPIELLTAEQEGGWTGHLFYLPARFELGSSPAENIDYYLFRICYLTCQRKLGQNWPIPGQYSLEQSRLQARGSAPQILEQLEQELPGSHLIYQRLLKQLETATPDQAWLPWGHWMAPWNAQPSELNSPTARQEKQANSEPQTLLQAPAREEVEILEEDHEAIRQYTLQHYFEKVETIEEFQGTWRETDGSDDLSEHAEALQQLDLRQVVRSDVPVHAVLQTEFLLGSTASESREAQAEGYFISYPEWDYQKRIYKPDWCKVYPIAAQQKHLTYAQQTLTQHRATLQRLRQRFTLLNNRLEQVNRQLSGTELDLDTLTDNFADRRAGCPPDERVYLHKRRRRHESAILLLLDLSLSSDGYTGGQRILDVEKQAAILFAELLSEFGDRFAIAGFSSRTRHHCDYLSLKSFDEPWAKAASRIGAAEATGYTRIGPALRHASAQIQQERAQNRWIILLSDGKPNDYDRYEGRYGLADVRQAIKEARQNRVQIYGLAVEAMARHYLPMMLGQGSYQILPRPEHLPDALADFYGRLMRH